MKPLRGTAYSAEGWIADSRRRIIPQPNGLNYEVEEFLFVHPSGKLEWINSYGVKAEVPPVSS